MIKINLASAIVTQSTFDSSTGMMSDEFLSEGDTRKEALKRLVLLFAGALALYGYEQQNLPSKYEELDRKRADFNELVAYNAKQASSVAEIKKFKEDEALIETRIAALEKIAKDRQREIRVMELLQTVIPEKAWLTRLQITPDKVNIQGMAITDFEVSVFLEALTKSVFLMDVNLVSSTEVKQDNGSFKKFEISCSLERR